MSILKINFDNNINTKNKIFELCSNFTSLVFLRKIPAIIVEKISGH